MSRSARPTVAVIGAGNIARALLPLLGRARYRVTAIAAPRLSAARAAARGRSSIRAVTRLASAAQDASLLLLAVPDRRIASVARELASATRIVWAERTVLHHAGALGLEPLEPLRRAGAAVGLLHPLQCLGTAELASGLVAGSWARIEGDRRGRVVAERLARDLGLLPLRFPQDLAGPARVAYHAAASLVANDLVALLDLGAELLVSSGLSRRRAIRALAPLARGTLSQFESHDLGGAFTGPVRRGDLSTIAAHLDRLEAVAPEARQAHACLSLLLARAAARHGVDLPRGALSGLRRLVGRRPGLGL